MLEYPNHKNPYLWFSELTPPTYTQKLIIRADYNIKIWMALTPQLPLLYQLKQWPPPLLSLTRQPPYQRIYGIYSGLLRFLLIWSFSLLGHIRCNCSVPPLLLQWSCVIAGNSVSFCFFYLSFSKLLQIPFIQSKNEYLIMWFRKVENRTILIIEANRQRGSCWKVGKEVFFSFYQGVQLFNCWLNI